MVVAVIIMAAAVSVGVVIFNYLEGRRNEALRKRIKYGYGMERLYKNI
ncbi:MAG: hypothetical protein Q4B67_03365 [Eubacteriales bacterium]|nr:hypothetical protein [Eubacteriales bacterium]